MNKSDKIKSPSRTAGGDLCFIAACGFLIWFLSLPPIFIILLGAYAVWKIIVTLRL